MHFLAKRVHKGSNRRADIKDTVAEGRFAKSRLLIVTLNLFTDSGFEEKGSIIVEFEQT